MIADEGLFPKASINVDKIFRWTFHLSTQRFFLRFIMDSCPIDQPDVEKPNFYLWPGTSHQSSSGLRAMIHYWLIVCDSINDYQKWPDLILNLLSKLEAQTCKTSQPTHSHCLYLRLALMSPSDLEDFKKECLTANCEPFIRFAIEETCQSGSEWRRGNMELSLILGYVFLSQLW